MSKLNNEIQAQEKNARFWIDQAKVNHDHSSYVNASVAIGRMIGLLTARQCVNGRTENDSIDMEFWEAQMRKALRKFRPADAL